MPPYLAHEAPCNLSSTSIALLGQILTHPTQDLAMKTAAEQGAQIILAQDPDSDRFSAIEAKPSGGWTTFTGDQLGALFASAAFQKYKASGKPLGEWSGACSNTDRT